MSTPTIDDLKLRGAQLAHEALEQVIHHSERRRQTHATPRYPADMTHLNNRLDEILHELDLEPPC
jgi:hypothetical protein